MTLSLSQNDLQPLLAVVTRVLKTEVKTELKTEIKRCSNTTPLTSFVASRREPRGVDIIHSFPMIPLYA